MKEKERKDTYQVLYCRSLMRLAWEGTWSNQRRSGDKQKLLVNEHLLSLASTTSSYIQNVQ